MGLIIAKLLLHTDYGYRVKGEKGERGPKVSWRIN